MRSVSCEKMIEEGKKTKTLLAICRLSQFDENTMDFPVGHPIEPMKGLFTSKFFS